ncbi:hypothetical protein KUTeg_009009 [Tegillarca granosa]|uniref:Uncharacterized protein n=1 Tax=Tegillarca granosa TaxID=220873 RepID=A0ABQ9F7S8_TEGGR|nr:hypothetical protein KUTeg_009009 [Tegillarca granosa]
MQNDDVKLTVEQDKRILSFGERLLKKHGPQEHKIQYISQELRELGRLVICCKSVSNVKSVDDVLKSCNWDVLIKCIKIVAGYDEQSQMFKTPSLALKIGQSLEKCARYKRSDAIKENNKCKQKEAEDFLCLYKSDWKDDVSSVASNSLNDQKYNKAQLLPLTDDVVKLNKHLQSTANSLCKKIGNNPDLYSKLAQVLLTQVILFNRRRSGEAERMLLEGFNDAIKNGSGRPDPVVMSTLTEFEKHLCTSHTRVEIRGKRGRKVPVLLTDKMRQQIEVLVYNRNKANVKQPYLFARPGEFTKPYRGKDFDEIEFVPEKEILESESESETDDLTVIEKDVADVMDFSESDTPKNLSKKKLHVAVKKNFTKAAQTRHTWSKNEKIALECQFQKNINLEKVPCKLECLNAIKNQSCLARFTWKHIKYAVKNLITSRRRSLKKC